MNVKLHPTTKLVTLNGIPARIWEGATESGIEFHAFITRIAVDKDEPNAEQFAKELQEVAPPSAKVQCYPLSMIL